MAKGGKTNKQMLAMGRNLAKIANQMIYLSYVAAFCETARMAREAGLDVPNLVDVMRNSVSGDPLMTGWEKRLENGDRVDFRDVRLRPLTPAR